MYGRYLRLGAKIFPHLNIIANSAATADVAREYGFSKLFIVPLGADYVEQAENNGEVSLNDILYSGRIIKWKGLGWFVRTVLPLLPDKVRLKVAGTIWDEHEAQALNHPRVEYLGHLTQSDLRDEFKKAGCVILPNVENKEAPRNSGLGQPQLY